MIAASIESEVVIIPCVDHYIAPEGKILANSLYVAMTRARSLLGIYGITGGSPASRKLKETIAACIEALNSPPTIELAQLIDRYPELFRSTPFMPVLGNHDKEMRPRGTKPPEEPIYDIDATAFRQFFDLPDDEWKWHFDVPGFAVRFVALDLTHISDFGTTWQACHSFKKDSEQYRRYDRLMSVESHKFVVTLYNERNASMRAQERGAWRDMFRKGTIAITGFGYYAELAEVDGFTYYNTSLSGKGDQYADPNSQFLKGEDSYILMTFTKNPMKLVVEIKGLDGSVLDQREYFGR